MSLIPTEQIVQALFLLAVLERKRIARWLRHLWAYCRANFGAIKPAEIDSTRTTYMDILNGKTVLKSGYTVYDIRMQWWWGPGRFKE